MDSYLSSFPDWFLLRYYVDTQDILKITEDFLTNIDETTEETLLKYPNHNIVNAVKLRDALIDSLKIINDELDERKRKETKVI